MKNQEKYKNELMDVIKKNGRLCEFVKKHDVFRMFGKDAKSYCKMTCVTCGTALQLWLDEEYEEPPKPEVDWCHVPVDTLVRVRDSLNDDWKLAFFKGFYPLKEFKFATWTNAETSKTGHVYEAWMYCELVEEDDEE